MYTSARHQAPDAYGPDGLGFWGTVAAVGANIAGKAFGGDSSGNMPVEQYYPAVKRGQLLCPGPFRIADVQRALEDYPDLNPIADRVLSLDSAWSPGKYGPLDARGKAGALVNWAHGGRNCKVTAGEIGGTQGRAAVEEILRTAAERRTAAQKAKAAVSEAAVRAVDTIDVGTERAKTVIGGTNPLLLGLLGASAVALLARRR